MKKLVALVLLIMCLFSKVVYANNSIYINCVNETINEELYIGSLLSLLNPYLSDEVEKYYGRPKQFDLFDAKILSIKKTPEKFEFEIKVQVETFTGAHNPPGGIETITVLTSPMGTKTINFSHMDK